jgi:hypothetical protein
VYNDDINSIFLRKDIQCLIYRKHHDKSRMAKTERGRERERKREGERGVREKRRKKYLQRLC